MKPTSSGKERISQDNASMDRVAGREAIRRREIARLIGGLRRVRAVLISVAVLVMVWVLIRQKLDWALVTPMVVIALLLPIAIADLYRLRGPELRDVASVSVDLYLGLMGQCAVIAITGGIESPLLFVIFLMPLGAGVVLGPGARSRGLLWSALVAPWIFVGLGVSGLMPGTVPALLDLKPGFATILPYAASRAAAVNLASIVIYRLGLVIFETINRMLDAALEARRDALETQRERNRELVQLSSAIAHELKNPLATIKGLVQLIERGGKNEARRFEVLNREVDRTRSILDEFLNFSRPLGDLTVETMDLSELLRELTALHEGIAEEAGVRIEPAPPGPVLVRGDRRKLGQALINLLQNALEASSPGQSVQWYLRTGDEAVNVGVSDQGMGMKQDIRVRATQIGATTKPGGSGIGLAVVRTIAEQHGGQLEIQTPAEGGCTVSLSLPQPNPAEAP